MVRSSENNLPRKPPLSEHARSERRGFIRAEVIVRGRVLNFVTTHLDYQYDDGRLFEHNSF